jgi:hypothetical protein
MGCVDANEIHVAQDRQEHFKNSLGPRRSSESGLCLFLIMGCVCDIEYITHKTSRENTTVNKYNFINSSGSVSPAIDEGKEV